MVEVRKTGVSASPHSPAASIPVHSPAPLSTAPPAGTGKRNRSPPGSITVTPVRAVPRPAGGGGSSRQHGGVPQPGPGHVEHGSGRARWQQPQGDAKIRNARHPAMVTAAAPSWGGCA